MVSFLGTPNAASDDPKRPFSNQLGLWTATTQIEEIDNFLRERPRVPVPVIQVGDVVDGKSVNAVNVYDQLASVRATGNQNENPGSHRLAIHLATSNGNLIVRAERKWDVPVIFIPGVAGSVLAEQTGSTPTERWPGGMNPANFQYLTLEPGQERNIVALDAVRKVEFVGIPVKKVYENLLNQMTASGAGGLTEYKVKNDPDLRTYEGCDLLQAPAEPNLFIFA